MFNECTASCPWQSVRTAVGQRGPVLCACISVSMCVWALHFQCVLIRHNSSQSSSHFQGRRKGIVSHSDRLLWSLRFLVFGFLKLSALLAAWIHLRTRNDAFSDSLGGFFLFAASRGEAKGGQLREMLLRQSLPSLVLLLAWLSSASLLGFIFLCHLPLLLVLE